MALYLLCTVLLVFMTTHALLVAGALPKIATVVNNYPTYAQHNDAEFLILAGLPSSLIGQNTDVLRVSHALIQSGHTFDIDTTRYPDWSETVATIGGKKYIKLPSVMRKYLKNTEPASEIVSQSGDKADFNDKKGVIIFQNCYLGYHPGRVDLYNDNTVKGAQSFFTSMCRNIRIFTIA